MDLNNGFRIPLKIRIQSRICRRGENLVLDLPAGGWGGGVTTSNKMMINDDKQRCQDLGFK